ncbi:hypothetical protein BH09ACT12_BH09ACT12_18550 [soil metagenome]
MDFSLARCIAVWLTVTTAAVTAARWAAADLNPAAALETFDAVLPALAALVLIACALWAWSVTTLVVLAAVRHRPRGALRELRAVPQWAQRLVVGACGLVLVGAAQTGAAYATPVAVAGSQEHRDAGAGAVAGLPLPDRTTGVLRSDPAHTDPIAQVVGIVAAAVSRGTPITVLPCDSLWSLAERLLDDDAATSEVADLVNRLYDLNRAEIGSDPNLILPGQQLRTPLGERPTR